MRTWERGIWSVRDIEMGRGMLVFVSAHECALLVRKEPMRHSFLICLNLNVLFLSCAGGFPPGNHLVLFDLSLGIRSSS